MWQKIQTKVTGHSRINQIYTVADFSFQQSGKIPKPNQETLLAELKDLKKKLNLLLVDAQQVASESIQDFFDNKVSKMSGLIGHYYTAFCNLGVQSRDEMESTIGQCYHVKDIREAAEELFESEEEWNSFLRDFDKKAQLDLEGDLHKRLVIGEQVPVDLKVTEVRSQR